MHIKSLLYGGISCLLHNLLLFTGSTAVAYLRVLLALIQHLQISLSTVLSDQYQASIDTQITSISIRTEKAGSEHP